MFKSLIRILSACMAAAMILCAAAAQADTVTYAKAPVYIVSNTLNAYQSPDTNSRVLGLMTYGESMLMHAFGNGWVQIQNTKGQIGYCRLDGLSTVNPNNLNETVYAKADYTRVYAKADASYYKYVHVRQNYAFNVVAMTPDQQYFRVRNGNIYGYVKLSDVNRYPVSTHGALMAQAVYVNSENSFAVTTGKGSGSSLGTVSHGQSFTLLGVDGNYAILRNSKGQVGFCETRLLTTSNPNTMNRTMYAQVSGDMLYSSTLLKNGTARYLRQNTAVTVVSETPGGGWYRVLHGGKYYYVPSELLDVAPASTGGTELQCTASHNLYSQPTLSSAVTGRVSAGESVMLKGISGIGALVTTFDGRTGYLPFGCLQKYEWTYAA